MATVKFLNAAGKYDDPGARHDVINYIFRQDKTPGRYIGGYGVELTMAAVQMQAVAESFKKDNKVRIRHFVISLYQNEPLNLQQTRWIAEGICQEIGQTYQIVYAVHEDTRNPHIHFVFNPVSHLNGHKYSGTREEHRALKELLGRQLCRHGIRVFYEVKYRPESANQHE